MESKIRLKASINNFLWACISLVAAGTVAQVWAVVTPGVADIAAKQKSIEENIVYIRERVDQIADRVK